MENNVKRPALVTLIRKLLQEYPMYQYRKNGSLAVLLAAGGRSMEDISKLLQEILPNGQLLDTELSVTVYADGAANIGADLVTKAEDLPRFVTIHGVTVSKKTEWSLATLSFTSELPADEYPYRLYCGADPEENVRMAKTCGCAEGQLVACLCDDVLVVTSPEHDELDTAEDTEQKELYERIAYNANYTYAKYNDPRASREEIDADFDKDGYNYTSSLAQVIHMRSKLACCGITEPDLTKAAAQFARLIKEKPEIIGKLAVLEHRRWLLEKLLKKLRLPKNLDVIYSTGEDKTHSKDWHAALLPCSGEHRLRLADWKTDGSNCRAELDPLDRMSLDVHKKCKELADERMDDIQDTLKGILTKLLKHKDFPNRETALAHFYSMEAAISQMYQKKRIAIRRYRWSRSALLASLPADPLMVKKINNDCDAIDDYLKPLFEYVVDKDYKELNYLMVQQIPFAITHRKEITLAKLFDSGTDDCQFAPWQMEPTDIIYIGFADSEEALVMLSRRAKHIAEFLKHSCNETKTLFHVLVPPEVDAPLPPPDNLTIRAVESREPAVIQAAIEQILSQHEVHYFDLTCGTPVLSGPAERYAADRCAQGQHIGTFYVSGTQMFSIHGAGELEYPAPAKGISVREMFIQTGAAQLESEGSQIGDLSNVNQEFWETADSTEEWDRFCKFISDVCNEQKSKKSYTLAAAGKKGELVTNEMRMHSGILQKLLPVLRDLEARSYIEDLKLTWIVGDLIKLEFRAREKAANKLCQNLTEIAENDLPVYYYDLKSDGKAILAKTLKLKNIELPQEFCDEYVRLLKALEKADVIYSLNQDVQETRRASFTISALEFLSALRNSGKVLEYYIYNTALQECQFEDVDMSWKFYHSEDADSAHNEVDVICTKGTTSLFISAKNVKLDTFKRTSNYLNYVCYEVSVLASRFGINAKTVLAAPNVPQFDDNGNRSQRVKHAMSRGVYLLGDKCFEPGCLGKVLDNIARGEENWCECLLDTAAVP